MTLEEGCLSLKLECALRELGFVDLPWCVVANAGLYFVFPVGFSNCSTRKELLGFQVSEQCPLEQELRADRKILPSAKRALDFALQLP